MFQLFFWAVRYLPVGGWRQLPRRIIAFGLAIPFFILLQVVHWLGFLVDELFFRGYRRVKIEDPIFITGIPRSGTTHLQRVMAEHEQVSGMKLWECVFAPSITERHIYRFLGRILKPIGRLLKEHKSPIFEKMRSIHQLGLTEPEEDFMVLTTINACFLLVVFFPDQESLWRLVRFDQQMANQRRKIILKFYRRMLQKHLYVHGESLRYICKNPSFMSWQRSVLEEFPSAKFIVCHRAPEKTLASQISSLAPAWQLIHGEPISQPFVAKLIVMMEHYYTLLAIQSTAAATHQLITMRELVADLTKSVTQLCAFVELPVSASYQAKLDDMTKEASEYRSAHQYALGDYGIDYADLSLRFEGLYDAI